MASLPVPSLQTGGLWWFQDLTLSDPIYVLPLVVTATMWGVLEVSPDWPNASPAKQTGSRGKVIVQNGHSHSLEKEFMGKKFEPQSLKLMRICYSSSAFFFFWQLGAETGVQSADLQWMRNVMRLMPLAVLPITIHFPSVGSGVGAGSKSSHLA